MQPSVRDGVVRRGKERRRIAPRFLSETLHTVAIYIVVVKVTSLVVALKFEREIVPVESKV
jgi:hypothetical protein